MHIPPTPTSAGGANHKTLLQIEAYLAYNLDITTSLIDATRANLASIETQLATPAAAGAKTKRTLKNARARCVKKLRQCRGEAEMLTKALDEVKSQIAGTEAAMGSRISVVGQMGAGGSYTSSPLDGMSERSSSISSYISSAELSSGALPSPAFAYSPHGSPMVYTPLTAMEPGQPPYFHTNMPPLAISTHNLPSAPLYSAAHYLMSPYTPHVYPQMEAYSAYPTTVSWNPYTYLTTDFQHPVQPPVSMPLTVRRGVSRLVRRAM